MHLFQGYIILTSNIDQFLEIKYEVQQISVQRIRDLIFLFLAGTSTDIDQLLEHEVFSRNLYNSFVYNSNIIA